MIPQKKKNNSTTNNKPTQLSVIAVLEKNTFIDAEISCFLKVLILNFVINPAIICNFCLM